MEKRAVKISVTQNLPGLPRQSLIDGGKGLGLFFLSSLSACVFGGSTNRNKKETLCELCALERPKGVGGE
jgi:hypothetical protein